MKGILLILILFSSFVCFAQQTIPATLTLYQITEQNGLSDNHVQCVLKDHLGLLWVGTSDGLNLMDGARITIFRHKEKDSTSIISNTIYGLTEDSKNNIWIATDEGLCKYDAVKKKFSSFVPLQSIYGNPAVIKSIVLDNENNIWCGTFGGLFKFDTQKYIFTPFFNTSIPNSISVNRINHLFIDTRQILWLCTFDGVWSLNRLNGNFKSEINLTNDSAYEGLFLSICEDHNGNMWAGGWSKGLKELDRRTGKVTRFSISENDPYKINSISEIKQHDGSFVLWVNGPLMGFDMSLNKFFQYPKPLQLTNYPYITSVYTSPDQWQWMMSDNGLFIYNPQRQLFHHFIIKEPISSQGIAVKEWNKEILMGGEGATFLKSFDNNWNEQKDYHLPLKIFTSEAELQHTALLCILPVNKEELWLGTTEGLVLYNPEKNFYRWYRSNDKDSNHLPKNFIAHLLLDGYGKLWVFPWREGIWKMDEQQKFYRVFDGFINEGNQKKKLVIGDAVEDVSGNIWMADLDEGIVLYNAATKQFSKPFAHNNEHTNTNRIYHKNGFYYTVADRTLIKWTNDLHTSLQFNLPADMDRDVYDFTLDQAGHWWLATKKGLIVFDEVANNFRQFTTADGLVYNDMNGTIYNNSNTGEISFTSNAVITTFKPEELLQASTTVPSTLLTGILVNGNPVSWYSGNPLQLSYELNNLTFRWSIPDFTNPFNNQFYYKLSNIDKDWNQSIAKGEIQYANLSPGKYTLMLQGANSNGIRSGNIITIPFTILPPFWKTWWFLLLSIVLIALITYYWYRYRIRQALQLERIRTKISTDLHDDIGSTLSSISILSEIALKQNSASSSTAMITEIKDNSLSLMEKMDDIVWSINPVNDTLENLLLRIKRFAARLFEAKDIEYNIDIHDDIKSVHLPMEYRQHIYLILKEAVNNLVKYSDATHAEITVSFSNKLFQITISDNGKGFEQTTIANGNGNGILNMKHRAALMNGTLNIQSATANGTQIRLCVKIK